MSGIAISHGVITASEELYENQLLVWLLLIVTLLNLLLMVSMKETVDQAGASLSHIWLPGCYRLSSRKRPLFISGLRSRTLSNKRLSSWLQMISAQLHLHQTVVSSLVHSHIYSRTSTEVVPERFWLGKAHPDLFLLLLLFPGSATSVSASSYLAVFRQKKRVLLPSLH